MKHLLPFVFLFIGISLNAQLYFPPNNTSDWDTLAPSELDWCQTKIDSLYEFLDEKNTKSFVLLKDGKIVLEKYFDGHSQAASWYWASAGKTLTAFMVGMAQQENLLNITDPTSLHLGQGWTSCTPIQEDSITIRNQLTMTSGLDDGVADVTCTDDSCLVYLAPAGTRWAYHNAPYTLLDQVIANASGQSLNLYTTQKVITPTGMDGVYIPQDNNVVFFSTARSMARFGLLVLNKGNWDGNQIMTDTTYFNEMVSTSQDVNKSYGYLWWLNGKDSYRLPQSQIEFPGSMMPSAPNDMFCALGKNGQFLNVVPSQNMVWVRMGDAPDNTPVPVTLNEDIWKYINDLECTNVSIGALSKESVSFYPNPVNDNLFINSDDPNSFNEFKLFNLSGEQVMQGQFQERINLSSLTKGFYYLHLEDDENFSISKLIKE